MIFRVARQRVSWLLALAWVSGRAEANQAEPPAPAELTAVVARVPVGRAAAEAHLRGVAALTRPELVEPAGAHGSMGTAIGVGAANLADPVAVDPGAVAEADREARTRLPRAWLVKGTPIPIDLGFVGGADPEAGLMTAGAVVQGTVFERPGLPALSLRAGAGKTFGMPTTEMRSLALEAAAGMGFLRYFQAYGVIGAARHEGSFREVDDGPVYALRWLEPTRKLGLRVAVLPFIGVTGESSFRDEGGVGDWLVKVAVGM